MFALYSKSKVLPTGQKVQFLPVQGERRQTYIYAFSHIFQLKKNIKSLHYQEKAKKFARLQGNSPTIWNQVKFFKSVLNFFPPPQLQKELAKVSIRGK
jgi:hypothetical protein